MFSSNDSHLLKVKLFIMFILSIIVCEMILVIASPVPMMFDDIARVSGTGAKNLDAVGDASKGMGAFRAADDLAGTNKAINLDSVSNIRGPGSKLLDSGKNFDSPSPALNGKDPTKLPGVASPSGTSSFDNTEGLIPTVMGRYKDWGNKATQSLSNFGQASKSQGRTMWQGLGRFKKLPNFSKTNLKSWFVKVNSRARQSLSNAAIARSRQGTATLGREPWNLKRIAGFFPIKSFKSLMTKLGNNAVQSFSKFKQALRRSPAMTGQGSRQFAQRIGRLFPKKSFNTRMASFKNMGKGLVERVQKLRQTRKVQPEKPSVPETQPGQAGKTAVPDEADDVDVIDGFRIEVPSADRMGPSGPKAEIRDMANTMDSSRLPRFKPSLGPIKENPSNAIRFGQGPGQFVQRIGRTFPKNSFNTGMARFKNMGKGLVERVQKLRQPKKVQPEKPLVPETQPGQAGKTAVPDEADDVDVIDGVRIEAPSPDRMGPSGPKAEIRDMANTMDSSRLPRFKPSLEPIKENPSNAIRFGQVPRQFVQRIGKLFPKNSFKGWMARFKDMGKGLVERVLKLRQPSKVQPVKAPTLGE